MRASSQQVYAEQSGKMDHEYSSGAPNRSALKAEGNGESRAAGFGGAWVRLTSGSGETPGGWSLRTESERNPEQRRHLAFISA